MASAGDIGRASEPFVLTLEMDGEAFAFFNELRRRHYPPERNVVPAHVTLFHSLPGDRAREIRALLGAAAGRERPVDIAVGEARTLERGVAIFLHSPQLHALRAALQREWRPWLTDQDKAGFSPHVTIQNNVSAAAARATAQSLSATVAPSRMRGDGLHLWRYRDGPWEHDRLFPFRR